MQNAITGAIEIASIRSTSVNTQLTLSHIAQKYEKSIKNRRDTEHTTKVAILHLPKENRITFI